MLELFEHMELLEAIYKGARGPSKNKQPKAEANRVSDGNSQGGETIFPKLSVKVHTVNHKIFFYGFNNDEKLDTP